MCDGGEGGAGEVDGKGEFYVRGKRIACLCNFWEGIVQYLLDRQVNISRMRWENEGWWRGPRESAAILGCS